jgi:hypothetical protein
MISIVIPYVHEAAKGEELRFSIRSISENLNTDFKISIIADEMPLWSNDINFIEHIRKTGVGSKMFDSWQKMNIVVNHPEITDDFIYWYDDIYLLSKINLSFFDKQYSNGLIRNLPTRKSNKLWYTYLYFTEGVLIKEFKNIYNYENHMPRLFNKELMKHIIKKYDPFNKDLFFATLYYNNYYKNDPVILNKNDNIKAGFYGANSAQSFETINIQNIEKICQDKIFLNHNDHGYSESMKLFISKIFRKKCKYEK